MTVKITRLGAKFGSSPSVSIEYLDENNKYQYRRFDVAFSYFSNKDALYQTFVTDYEMYFNKDSIDQNKLKKFIQNIIEKSPKLDLGKAKKEDIDRFKDQMNKEFEMNVIKPGDPGYQDDVRVDFDVNPNDVNEDWD